MSKEHTPQAPAPFAANDPLDATAERLRVLVLDAVLGIHNTRAYKQLSPQKQVEAVLGGLITGTVSVAFASIEPLGRDDIIRFIKDYVDQARVQVEGIQFSEGTIQ